MTNKLPAFLLCSLFLACGQLGLADQENILKTKPAYPTLGATPFPADYPLPVPEKLEVSKRVHKVVANNKSHPAKEEAMKPYDLTAERVVDASLRMLAIPGGEFAFGSDREGEGPSRHVHIEPFWMAETEITWAFYAPFHQNGVARNKDGTLLREGQVFRPTIKGTKRTSSGGQWEKPKLIDVVSQPTPQYHDFFLSGYFENKPEFPAMCMTHHAASKFCQWLSAQTGHFYRLPTEAEWEYACRAGSTSAYSFGDDPSKIDDHAWHYGNSEETYHRPKQKKPNAWGLYDMHGNVAEWVLDGYNPKFRASLTDRILNPWSIPLTRYPRIAKGGSWYHDAEDLRTTTRELSSNEWKELDPGMPKSIWYHNDSQHVGFRIIRPLKTPSAEEMHLFWNTDWWAPKRNAEEWEDDLKGLK